MSFWRFIRLRVRLAFRKRLSPMASCLGVPVTLALLVIVAVLQIKFLDTVRKYLPASVNGPLILGSSIFVLMSPAVATVADAILLGAIRNRRARRHREQRAARSGREPA
jgi:hypothetical protein